MPTLFKHPKKKRNRNCSNGSSKVYNNKAYKELRAKAISEMPVCLVCLSEDKVTPTQEIHHINKIANGNTDDEQVSLLLDYENLIGLCINCHKHTHARYNISTRTEQEMMNKLREIRKQYFIAKNEENCSMQVLKNGKSS